MLHAGLEALQLLFTPDRLMWMGVGVFLGIVVGILPGLSCNELRRFVRVGARPAPVADQVSRDPA